MLDLQDKTLLVSIRHAGKEPADDFYESFIADVLQASEGTVMVRRRSDRVEVALPFLEDAFSQAEPGFYELKDGSTCEDPSYEVRLTRYASDEVRQSRIALESSE